MYGDLYQLLVPGFLSAKVTVNGQVLSLRSLTTRDLYLMAGVVRQGNPEWRLWAVAYAVWMVNGVSLLEDSTYSPRVVYDHLKRSNKAVITSLYALVTTFFNRSRSTFPYLESFLYEEESRRLWHSTRAGHISLAERSGIPGVDRLGLNMVQCSWVAWNRLEDEREEYERAWTLAKVNVALQSAKSSQKLEARDKNRLETERMRRQDVQTRAYQIYTGELKPGSDSHVVIAGLKVHSTRTAEDLFEEMRRIQRGEQDDHDRVVAEHKERIRQGILEMEEERTRIVEAAKARRERAEQEQQQTGSRTRLVAFTPEELASRFPASNMPGAKTLPLDDRGSRTFERYLREIPQLPPEELVQAATETPTQAPQLQDLIESRRPKFDGQ